MGTRFLAGRPLAFDSAGFSERSAPLRQEVYSFQQFFSDNRSKSKPSTIFRRIQIPLLIRRKILWKYFEETVCETVMLLFLHALVCEVAEPNKNMAMKYGLLPNRSLAISRTCWEKAFVDSVFLLIIGLMFLLKTCACEQRLLELHTNSSIRDDPIFCSGIAGNLSSVAFDCEFQSRRLFDVVLVSTGGVGSSSIFSDFQQRVSSRINSAGDHDGLKHRPYRRTIERLRMIMGRKQGISCSTAMFVYIFDDVAASVLSLYRRNFHLAHNKKLNDVPFPLECFPKLSTMYAGSGIDYFNLQAHFHSWLLGGLCSHQIPVFFFRSTSRNILQLWEILSAASQGNLGPYNTSEIPRETSTSHYKRDERTKADYYALKNTYKVLQEELDSLGHLSVAFNGYLRRLV